MNFLGLWPGGWANERLMTMFYALTLFYGVTWTVKGTSWWQLKQRSDTAPALSVDCLACYGELFNWIFLITICEEGEREWQSSWTMNAIRTVYRQNKRITSMRDCLTRMRKEGGFLCIWFLQLRTLMIHMENTKAIDQMLMLVFIAIELIDNVSRVSNESPFSSCSKAVHPWDRSQPLSGILQLLPLV